VARDANGSNLATELGNHHGELQRTRHAPGVELARGREREQRLEEVIDRESRTEVLDRPCVLVAHAGQD
jgi:hypothetical protein